MLRIFNFDLFLLFWTYMQAVASVVKRGYCKDFSKYLKLAVVICWLWLDDPSSILHQAMIHQKNLL